MNYHLESHLWKPLFSYPLHQLFLFSHCWIASFQQTDLFSHLNSHFIFHSQCVIFHELFLLISHLINQKIYVFPEVLYLFAERCAHFFKEGDKPNWDLKSLHISSAPAVKIASLPLAVSSCVGSPAAFFISWHLLVVLQQCSTDLCFICAPIAACFFVPILPCCSTGVLLSCCSFHNIAVTHFVYSDPCLSCSSDQPGHYTLVIPHFSASCLHTLFSFSTKL